MGSSLGDFLPLSTVPRIELFSACVFIGVIYLICSYTIRNEDESPVPFRVPIPEQCAPGWRGVILEKPSIKISGTSAIQCYCPNDGSLLGQVNPVTPDGIDRAVARAKEAQVEWAKTLWGQRRKVLKTMLKYILANQETIAKVACLDSGKTKIDASIGEILITAEKLNWTIQHGERILRPERRPTNFLMMYKYNEVRWEPLGVVAACVSWNYPFHNLMGPIISTLFSGSALVIKCSEQTAWSLSYFVSIARASLTACGHSPHLIQPIVCWPQTANHLTSHPGISHITFIGSRPVAHAVCTSAARALTPVCVELGGKDPSIILDDVRDLDQVASILMRGVFISAGQNCVGIERIIALPAIYKRLSNILELRIRSLRLGFSLDEEESVDVGAMISSDRFDHLETLIAEAVSQGAKVLVGGKRYIHPRYPQGHYFTPTLIIDVLPSMRIAQEELFAPVCVLMRALSLSTAIELANSTRYSLGASVFGSSFTEINTVIQHVKAGMVSVNDFGIYYAVQLPFGGVGGSGYGRFAGAEGLRGICNVKSVCRDRWPRVIGTSIPKAMDYPYGDARRGWGVSSGVVELGYGEKMRDRIRGLWRVLRNC